MRYLILSQELFFCEGALSEDAAPAATAAAATAVVAATRERERERERDNIFHICFLKKAIFLPLKVKISKKNYKISPKIQTILYHIC